MAINMRIYNTNIQRLPRNRHNNKHNKIHTRMAHSTTNNVGIHKTIRKNNTNGDTTMELNEINKEIEEDNQKKQYQFS